MATVGSSKGVMHYVSEAVDFNCMPEQSSSQVVEGISKNMTATSSSGKEIEILTRKTEGTSSFLTSLKAAKIKDAHAEKRVHALEASLDLSLKEISAAQSLRATGKAAMKRPMRAGIPRPHESGTSDIASLKKALRGLTLAQASELASTKRASRTPGSTHLSDAPDAIKQRYRAVLEPQLLEASTSKCPPRIRDASQKMEASTMKLSHKGTEISDTSNSCSAGSSSFFNSCTSVTSTSDEKDGDSYEDTLSKDNRTFSDSARTQVGENEDKLHSEYNNHPEIIELGTSSDSEPGQEKRCRDFNKGKNTKGASLDNASFRTQVNGACRNCENQTVTNKKIGGLAKSASDATRKEHAYVAKALTGSKHHDKTDCVDISKGSASRGSTSSGLSEESTSSSLSSSGNRPHMSNDSKWEAIRTVRKRDGCLGLKHFRLLRRLGSGDIGSVYLTELNDTKCCFAMKVMDNGSLASRKKLLRAQTEREILQMLDHPFLPTLYTHFETDRFSCLVMDFCPGGDLHILRQLQQGRSFSEQAARFYAAEVLLALEYLHMLGVVYRDLKPENVLVKEDGHIMLSDFDLSLRCSVNPTLVKSTANDPDPHKRSPAFCIQPACMDPVCVDPPCVQPSCFVPRFLTQKSNKARKAKLEGVYQVTPFTELVAEPTSARSNSFVGTHEYLAPEIVKGEGHGSAVDWWTFGIFLYELLFGKTPFKGEDNATTFYNVVELPLKFPETPIVSYAAKDLIRGLLVKEPEHRLAFRRGAAEIKQHAFFEGLNWALVRCSIPPEIPKIYNSPLSFRSNSTRGNISTQGQVADPSTEQ